MSYDNFPGLLDSQQWPCTNASTSSDFSLDKMKASMRLLKEKFPKPLAKQIVVATDKGLAWLRSQMTDVAESSCLPLDLLYGIPVIVREAEWEALKVALDYHEDGYEVIFLKDSGIMHQIKAEPGLSVSMMIDGQWETLGTAKKIEIKVDGLSRNQLKRQQKRLQLVERYAGNRMDKKHRLMRRWNIPIPPIQIKTAMPDFEMMFEPRMLTSLCVW